MTSETPTGSPDRHIIELRHEEGVIPNFLKPNFERVARDVARNLGIENFRQSHFDVSPEDIVEVDGDPKRLRTKRVVITTDLSEEFRTAFVTAMTQDTGYVLSAGNTVLKIHEPPPTDSTETVNMDGREAV